MNYFRRTAAEWGCGFPAQKAGNELLATHVVSTLHLEIPL